MKSVLHSLLRWFLNYLPHCTLAFSAGYLLEQTRPNVTLAHLREVEQRSGQFAFCDLGVMNPESATAYMPSKE